MEKTGFTAFFLKYLRARCKTALLLLFFIGCFYAVFRLYGIPTAAVRYAALLCFAGALVFAVIDAALWYSRYAKLFELKNTVTLGISALPEPRDEIEKLYQELLSAVDADRRDTAFRADCSKSELIDYFTMWAHQIKTPIAAMRLILQSGNGAEDTELTQELFNIEQYVEMVLGYLRLDSEFSDYVLKSLDTDAVVRQTVRKYASFFIRKRIRLNYEPLGFSVVSDEKWLMFVIGQLLSNALKYTKDGSISIYAEGKTLVIEDTGIGIAQEDLPRVFEKGFTGYNGREDRQSTGIGLYLCKKILHKLGHGISIESAPGIGTKVMIDLESADIRHE